MVGEIEWEARIEWYEGMEDACLKRDDDLGEFDANYWRMKAQLARQHIVSWEVDKTLRSIKHGIEPRRGKYGIGNSSRGTR